MKISEIEQKVKTCQRSTCGNSIERGYSYLCTENKETKEIEVTEVTCLSCAQADRYGAWKETKVITSRLLTDSIFLKDSELSDDIGFIQEKVKRFQADVWFCGMQKTVNDSTFSGMSFKCNNLTVLSFCCAGRCMITIEDKESSVTLITDPTTSRGCMGLQGINATREQALNLLQAAIVAHKRGCKLEDDRKVGLMQ